MSLRRRLGVGFLLEAGKSILLDEGELHLGSSGRERLRNLRPVAQQASTESSAHPKGPVPAELLLALAWNESSLGWDEEGVPLAGGHVAEGPWQIHSKHYGRDFFTSPPFDLPDRYAFTWREGIAKNDLLNARAAVHLLLEDFELGQVPIAVTLRRYVGDRGELEPSTRDYVEKLVNRYYYLLGLSWVGGG